MKKQNDLMADFVVTVEEEVATVFMERPHVVVLGAGASKACCPNGDRSGNLLPLMDDFVNIVGLKNMFSKFNIDPNQNFEDVYSKLWKAKQSKVIRAIEEQVESYFFQLKLPEKPTIYDHLILSLRRKDLIATFNWDPLLIQAYIRNQKAGLSLPKLAFLHGNVYIGYCWNDKIQGLNGYKCNKCQNYFTATPLLYPISQKKYSEDHFIANEWSKLKTGFANAFMITIFGYSAPTTDKEALDTLKKAWGNKYDREMEQTSFITIQSEDEIRKNWMPFIHTHHYEVDDNFYDSWIANHPRRTGEAYWHQYLDAKFITKNPIPKDADFSSLWRWFEKFRELEK